MPLCDDLPPDPPADDASPTRPEVDRRLQMLFQKARHLAQASSAEAMAYLAATSLLTAHPPPPALRAAFDQVQQRSACDPEWQAQYDRVARRVREVHDRCDPREHFERLTGRSLSGED